MARPHLSFLSARDKEFVHEQTVRVLEEVGIGFNSAKAIALLEAAGAPVDRQKLTARIPRGLLSRCLATAPRRVIMAARDPAHDIVLDDGEPLACCADGEGCLVMDDVTGQVRDATVRDVRDTMRLYDALPEIDFLWTSLSTSELNPVLAPLALDAIALRESSKHLQSVSPKTLPMVPALLDMLEAVAGATLAERPIYSLILCTIAPLQHDPAMTDACLDLCRHGVTLSVTPAPQMGSTAPMTVLGTTIVDMAELLSAVVLYQLAKPGCAIIHGPVPGASDMRSGSYVGCPRSRPLQPGVCRDEPLLRHPDHRQRQHHRCQGGRFPGGRRGHAAMAQRRRGWCRRARRYVVHRRKSDPLTGEDRPGRRRAGDAQAIPA
jgi:trimethylamine--corrinoid protein Co-methyltransferase